jgi:hypothetical protein
MQILMVVIFIICIIFKTSKDTTWFGHFYANTVNPLFQYRFRIRATRAIDLQISQLHV